MTPSDIINPSAPRTIVVGMSGGVDSSVAALLLKQQGHRVIGLFMKNWEELDENGVCTSAQDYDDAARVCDKLEIPYYSVEFINEYREQVFSHFLAAYRAGHTPNPDILCNREIKFNVFFKRAMEMGADFLATGHYAQNLVRGEENRLIKGNDPGKDQSYFLYTLKREILERVLFPIGHLPKSEVRELAAKHGLPTATKKDSTGICFIGERDFRKFLSQYVAAKAGEIQTLSGEIVGEHQGAAYYTMGQRKGLGLGGEGAAWFVVAKDTQKNIVYVERGAEHPALFADYLIAQELTWVSGAAPKVLPLKCRAKARYRQVDQDCEISVAGEGQIRVDFEIPQRALTPGQSVVFYLEDQCLGGAVIDTVGPSYFDQRKPLPQLHGN